MKSIRKHFFIPALIVGAVLLSQEGQFASAQGVKVQIPPYQMFTLDNGLKVVLMEYHRLPIVEMQMTVGGGTSIDPDTLAGLASMTAELLKQGTITRSATQLAEQVDFIGGTLNAGASQDQFSISGEYLTKDTKTGLDLFSDVILNAQFPQDEIDRERSQRIATLDRYKEEPQSIAGVYFNKLIYANHPYGHQSIGTSVSLKKIAREAIVQFYRETFLPNNSLLVVVGDFQSDEMLSQLKQTFGGWKRGYARQPKMTAQSMHAGRRLVIVNKPDVTQTQIRIGNVGVDVKNPDRYAIQVANTILGGGFTSRLVDEIRVKRSLTYGVSSRFSFARQGGLYGIFTFSKNPTTRQTIDVALEEVKKFREKGATEQELKKAQNYLAGDFARELQAPENLSTQLSQTIFYELPGDFLQTYVEKLKNVTLDDVKGVANKYFHYDDLIIMVVTNSKETKASLEGLGKVEEVPVEKTIE